MIQQSDSKVTRSDIEQLVNFVNFVTEKAVFNSLTSRETLNFGQQVIALMNLKQKLDKLIQEDTN